LDGSLEGNLFLPRTNALDGQGGALIGHWIAQAFPEFKPLSGLIAAQLLQSETAGITRAQISAWHWKDKLLLMGDAAHAVYHFYGQGINASLEDCSYLRKALAMHGFSENTYCHFEAKRKPEADALDQLSQKHFTSLRNEVGSTWFAAELLLEQWLHGILGDRFLPHYCLISRASHSYKNALTKLKTRRLIKWFSGIFALQAVIAGAIWLKRSAVRKIGSRKIIFTAMKNDENQASPAAGQ
jgi:kynurenine 3-monooxygenase